MFNNQISKALLDKGIKLSLSERGLLDILIGYDHGKGAWPSIETLAKLGSCSENTVRKHLKALQAKGLILIENRGSKTNLFLVQLTPQKLSQGGSKIEPKQSNLNNQTEQLSKQPIPKIITEKLSKEGIDTKQLEPLVIAKKLEIAKILALYAYSKERKRANFTTYFFAGIRKEWEIPKNYYDRGLAEFLGPKPVKRPVQHADGSFWNEYDPIEKAAWLAKKEQLCAHGGL